MRRRVMATHLSTGVDTEFRAKHWISRKRNFELTMRATLPDEMLDTM